MADPMSVPSFEELGDPDATKPLPRILGELDSAATTELPAQRGGANDRTVEMPGYQQGQLTRVQRRRPTQPASATLESTQPPPQMINAATFLASQVREILLGHQLISPSEGNRVTEFMAGPEARKGIISPFGLLGQILGAVDRMEYLAHRRPDTRPHIIVDLDCRWAMGVTYGHFGEPYRVSTVVLVMQNNLGTIFDVVRATLAAFPQSTVEALSPVQNNCLLAWSRKPAQQPRK